jgi:hypothetical protein
MTPSDPQPPNFFLIDLQQSLIQGPTGFRTLLDARPYQEHHPSKNIAFKHLARVVHVEQGDIADPTNVISSAHPEIFAPHTCASPRGAEEVFKSACAIRSSRRGCC